MMAHRSASYESQAVAGEPERKQPFGALEAVEAVRWVYSALAARGELNCLPMFTYASAGRR
jgi:hypothetical protein